MKLWDYEKEIKAGQFPALAPLLSMLVEEPTEETLIEERKLILHEKDERKREHLFATAIMIASRYFERDFLWKFFGEEVENMRSVPFIQEWMEQERQEGQQAGYTQAYKESIVSFLESRFGIVKPSLLDELEKVKRVESLKMLLHRTIKVQTQEEFLSLIKLAAGN